MRVHAITTRAARERVAEVWSSARAQTNALHIWSDARTRYRIVIYWSPWRASASL